MEVHIRNVPEQVTVNGLKQFLKPHLHKLSIQSYHCQKQRGKKYASLTFLHIRDGERFLSHYGQVRSPTAGPKTRPQRASNYAVNLIFLNQPIYCEKSTREGDRYLFLKLEREERERQEIQSTAVYASSNDPGSRAVKILPLTFECSFASCGVWTYLQSELVYAPQLRWTVNGEAKFRERDLILQFWSGESIEFPYASILNITIETGSTASFIISMREPPRFFAKINDPTADLMAQLRLTGAPPPRRWNSPERHRLPYLGVEHEPIAANCLVYRIMLPAGDSGQVGDQMHRLQQVNSVPEMVHHRTRISPGIENLTVGFKNLRQILSSQSMGLPFALKFQIQKLAENNYLLPEAVIRLIPEVTNMMMRSTIPVCVSAIKKLFTQINFPGQDIEADQLEVESIISLLQSNENNYNKYGLPVDTINAQQRSDNVAIIHKAKVTPSGICLYGPEAESNNRILRKYPDHHDYFIRVQFCDEDGQPIRFISQVSLDRIFNGRFKKVLREGIKIAERVYSFLGFSHSSLRSQSCWFMAPFVHNGSLISDRMLISDLGDFTVIRSPAKCAARIGQTFSDTPTAISIDPRVVRTIADVEVGSRVFSDGVGVMSTSVWQQITDGLRRKGTAPPTCFQIRYAGMFVLINYFPLEISDSALGFP